MDRSKKRLERLTQDESGRLHRPDGRQLNPECALPRGKLRTLVVQNPCIDVSRVIDNMVEEYPSSVPVDANSYLVSDFCGDTQHVRRDGDGNEIEGMFSVYALQFYWSLL